jgi:hypothetical protein
MTWLISKAAPQALTRFAELATLHKANATSAPGRGAAHAKGLVARAHLAYLAAVAKSDRFP